MVPYICAPSLPQLACDGGYQLETRVGYTLQKTFAIGGICKGCQGTARMPLTRSLTHPCSIVQRASPSSQISRHFRSRHMPNSYSDGQPCRGGHLTCLNVLICRSSALIRCPSSLFNSFAADDGCQNNIFEVGIRCAITCHSHAITGCLGCIYCVNGNLFDRISRAGFPNMNE